MKRPDSLFELIHCLGNNEKRYISIALQGEDKECIKLYNAIKKQKQYNEKRLLSVLKKPPITHFRAVKQYVHKLVLKNMRAYRADVSVQMQLRTLLIDLQFLLKKGLYIQTEKLIAKAKKLSLKYEEHSILLELLHLERTLMKRTAYEGKTTKQLESNFKQTFKGIATYKQIQEYDLLASRLFLELKKEGNRVSGAMSTKAIVLQQKMLARDETTLPYHARIHLYSYYLANANKEAMGLPAAYEYAHKQVSLLEEYPHLIEEEEGARLYAISAFNLLLFQLRYKKYEEMQLTIKKFQNVSVASKTLSNELFYISHSMELTLYITQGLFNDAVGVAQTMEQELEQNPQIRLSKEKEMILYYEFCNAYFGAGLFNKAKVYLNKVLQENVDVRSDIQCFAHLLNIVIHFELGNETLLKYLVKTTYKFLYKRKRLYKFETIVLAFIKVQLTKKHTQAEILFLFEDLKKELETLIKDPFEKRILDYFDFLSWIESKTEHIPFASIIQHKFNMLQANN